MLHHGAAVNLEPESFELPHVTASVMYVSLQLSVEPPDWQEFD